MVLSQKSIYTTVIWQCQQKKDSTLSSDEHQHLFGPSVNDTWIFVY